MISDAAVARLNSLLASDETASRYRLETRIGQGGMGDVYVGRDLLLDRDVAIKVVRPALAGSQTAERLAREARILARLEHPGIVPVHDVGRLDDGRLYCVMKLVRGDRLDAWAADHGEVHTRVEVFLRVCEAVAFAHARGIVHRDLKPANIMVGGFGEVLVLDWGVARLHGDADAGVDVLSARREETAHGTILGTPDYMAPEQARGDVDAVDERADVYALGVMLGELCAGVPALEAVSAKARARSRGDRYADVTALAAEVLQYQAGRAVGAYRERFADRAVRLFRRFRNLILLVAAYLAMRLLLLWLFRI